MIEGRKEPVTFGSLFAGIGGIDLGFERAGLKCKWQVEIDSYARQVLAKHWPQVRRHDDVRTWPQPDTEPVDIIAAGFPCQDISYAGKGAGLAGERSGLFYEVMRIVRDMGPRIIVLENVAALLTRGLDKVLGSLASLGYDAEWHCIPAAAVGAPHIRDRIFILAYSNSKGLERCNGTVVESCNSAGRSENVANAGCELRKPWTSERSKCNAQTERRSASNDNQRCSQDVADTNEHIASKERLQPSRELLRFSGDTQENFRRGLASNWSVEPDVGRVAHGVSNRVDRLRGLGNAVVPQVAEWIGRRLIESA